MANATEIHATLAVARENQHRLNMGTYADGVVDLNAATWQECGVTFCLAGFQCVRDGLRPQADWHGRATGRFVDERGNVYAARDWAARRMRLTGDEAHVLFVWTAYITDIDALDWVAERIIAGDESELVKCGDCLGEGIAYTNNDEKIPRPECHGRCLVLVEDDDDA